MWSTNDLNGFLKDKYHLLPPTGKNAIFCFAPIFPVGGSIKQDFRKQNTKNSNQTLLYFMQVYKQWDGCDLNTDGI